MDIPLGSDSTTNGTGVLQLSKCTGHDTFPL